MKSTTIRIVGACLCLALVASMAATPVTAQTDEERVLLELDADGDADVSVTFVYDLDNEDAQAAFEELRENETARTQLTERFENRMTAVATDASATTDREMTVRNVSIELQREGELRVIVLSVQWTNLASVEGDRLTVTEPFASGFESDRPFTVVAPDGYGIVSATPEPTSSETTSATWDAETTLEGFEVVLGERINTEADEATDESPVEDDTEDAAGFGVVVALLALLAATGLTARDR